jgi:betaine-aldehyde dehydrogenase
MTQVQNFINGEYADATSGETSPLVDPSTGESYGTAGISNEADVDRAYSARTGPRWPARRSPRQRRSRGTGTRRSGRP